jgi:hypothetical protein
MDEQRQISEQPRYGLVYGEIVYWMSLAGMAVAVIGSVLCGLGVGEFADSSTVLADLWAGAKAPEIWENATGAPVQGHWYLHQLGTADGISMLGVAICSVASLIAMWTSCIFMLCEREKRERPLFIALAAAVAAILTVSITGIF